MKHALQFKILLGFLLLTILLIIAGAYSIFEFRLISNTVNSILDDNYKSIKAANVMSESLEREDSGILLMLLGNSDEGRIIVRSSDSSFRSALAVAKKNLTDPEAQIIIDKIENSYNEYKENWYSFATDTAFIVLPNWYIETIQGRFLNVKANVDSFIDLNQKSLYDEAVFLNEKSKRAIMPGIVAIISAIVFIIMLNFFITKFLIAPINRITESVKRFSPGSRTFDAKITSNDEIKELEKSIKILIEKISNKMNL